MKNALGPIAEAYNELQGLPSLREAQSSFASRLTTPQAVDNTLAQCTEILLLTLIDLIKRANVALQRAGWAEATRYLEWCRDFSRALASVTGQALQNWRSHPTVGRFTLEDSNSLDAFLTVAVDLDRAMASQIPAPLEVFDSLVESEHLRLLDTYLVLWHEWLMVSDSVLQWDSPGGRGPKGVPGEASVHRAVSEPNLSGETFFQQFRACHQVPELLIWTANQFYLEAIERARIGEITQACGQMLSGNEFLELAQRATYPLVHNLEHREYHKIRENLGMTSGSHSQEIHVVLLTAIQNDITALFSSLNGDTPEDQLLRHLCVRFLTLTQAWRNMHAILPKRNLGMSGTRSLIGAPEATAIVEQLRRKPLPQENPESRLTAFLRNPDCFSIAILSALGNLTNKTFPDVQHRRGYFSSSSQNRKGTFSTETK